LALLLLGAAGVSLAAAASVPPCVPLATFDGTAPHKWHTENDPVMGGVSESTWHVGPSSVDGNKTVGVWKGVTRIVPSLHAPGFTIAMTESPPFVKYFPDISKTAGLALTLNNIGGNVTSFKVAFCDSRINVYRCQFGTFKASFNLTPGGFKRVFVPFTKFSDKWSAATGAHTKEDPPTAKSLATVSQVQLWVEGTAGPFAVEMLSIEASEA
jgi:hypothetical protein